MKKECKLYNIIFPVWMLFLFPLAWLIIIPSNFIIDSLVLIASIYALKINSKKQFYKTHIFKIFLFGMLSDIIGAVYMFIMMFLFEVTDIPDAPLLTVPGLLISSVMIFVFNYFITFKKIDKKERLKLSIIYAVITAPYTFLIPINWIY
jgi:hypothetical protein